jgi:hypothetical protein
MSKEKCFILMPITTHADYIKDYGGDTEHFLHVLEDLFCPAVEKVGFEPVPPVAEGNDLIHARIIQQIEEAPMALCDMSRLNANVFFELGIRTAVNKPVSMVVDDVTGKVPFDTGVLNHQIYSSRLDAWVVKKEIPKLATHIEKSFSGSKGQNSMWKYFGLHEKAVLPSVDSGVEGRLEILTSQIEALRKERQPIQPNPRLPFSTAPASAVDPSALAIAWPELLDSIGRASPFTRSYLADARPISLINGLLTVGFTAEFSDQMELVNNQKTQSLVQSKMAEVGFDVRRVKFVTVLPA